MNKIIISIILLFGLANLFGKEIKNTKHSSFLMDCVPGRAETFLNVNNVRARLLNAGDIWWDKKEGIYVVNAKNENSSPNIEPSAIHSMGLWIGGVDPVGNLKIAATGIYDPQFTPPNNELTMQHESDFYPGPINAVTGLTDFETCQNWDQIYTVTRNEVICAFGAYKSHKKDPNIPFTLDQIPDQVKYWPGKGNPYFQEAYGFELPLTGQGLAPFFDEDFDGVYDPLNGDIPHFDPKYCSFNNHQEVINIMPDQMSFRIINDSGGPHTITNGDQIQMEVHIMSYAYDIEAIENITYHRYKFINRANADIRNIHYSNLIDFDLGCSEDDFIGVDKERSLVYAYNKDAIDGDFDNICSTGAETYDSDIPIVGVAQYEGLLSPKKKARDASGDIIIDSISNAPILLDLDFNEQGDTLVEIGISSMSYINLDESGGALPKTMLPNSAEQYYNVMKGYWLDGTPITEGNCGLDATGTPTKMVFPGDPSKTESWSMCNDCTNLGDLTTVASSGPVGLLQPGAVGSYTLGVIWVPDQEYPCPQLEQFKAASDVARSIFDVCFEPSILDDRTMPINIGVFDFEIFPNPVTEEIQIELDKTVNVDLIEVFNSQGIITHSYRDKISTIDVQQLLPGVYYLKITDWTGIGMIKKFIKL